MAKLYRYHDSWVVDRVLFEFVTQGGCACCALRNGGPRLGELINMCSDVDTDDGKKERASTWPAHMHEDIWGDRVKLRRILKGGRGKYFQLHQLHIKSFRTWWTSLDSRKRFRMFQLSSEELNQMLQNTYDFNTAYLITLRVVAEQIKGFKFTGYEIDGTTSSEQYFEGNLIFTKGAWTVTNDFITSKLGIYMFLERLKEIGEEHILPRRRLPSISENEDHDGHSNNSNKKAEIKPDNDPEKVIVSKGDQSFRSDRRLVRLIIFRLFADNAWSNFMKQNSSSPKK